jgi:ribosome-binding ATPase YchF (GTP1/OBG family)
LLNTTKIVAAVVESYDIVGLVKEVSTGAGVCNKFPSLIRE